METKHCQLFTGDFITYGFKLYSHLKCKHFGDLVVIFEIAGDKVENIIRRAKKLALSNIVEYGLVRCRTSKINFNKAAKSQMGYITYVTLTLMLKSFRIKFLISGIPPRDYSNSARETRSKKIQQVTEARLLKDFESYFRRTRHRLGRQLKPTRYQLLLQ